MVLVLVSSSFWIAAITIYTLKIFSPAFDRWTAYGKLRGTETGGWISQGFGMTLFYALGLMWNSILVLFRNEAFRFCVGANHDIRVLSETYDNPFIHYFHPIHGAATSCYIAHIHGRHLPGMLLELHLLKRLFECLFVHRFSERGMVTLNAIAGIGYYTMLPFTINLTTPATHPIVVTIGVVVFLIGSLMQSHAHWVLAGLRVKKDEGYHVPMGGMFTYVSCPHYLGEIIIYLAFAILTRFKSWAVLCVLIFVVLNLTNNAHATHRWYIERFPRYPSRARVIPFLF